MRVTFVGATPLAVATASMLIERGHEVVIIDEDAETIEALSDELDCGFVTGDGTRPAVLREVDPEATDVLFCVSNRDEDNILAALVGRSLGFDRVVPKVADAELEPICTELGLDDVVVADRRVAQGLVDLVEHRESPELVTVVEAGLRFLTFRVPDDVHDVEGLALPDGARPIAVNRDGEASLVDARTRFQAGDEVVLIATEEEVDGLRQRFTAKPATGRDDADADGAGNEQPDADDESD